jgi:hypothetical protein
MDCPGSYCGQINITNVSSTVPCYTPCQACPTGYRVDNTSSLCTICDDPADPRDYLYLLFMTLLTLLMRLMTTTAANWYRLKSPFIIPLYVVPFIEVILAYIFTLLVLPPQGSILFNSCSVYSVNDFYPIFFNPTTDYVNEIRCTYEVVYPLYNMVFIFFGFHFVCHLPLLCVVLVWSYIAWSHNKREVWSPATEYLWLIAFPVLFLLHGVFAGLIYYSFGYLTIGGTLVAFSALSTSFHFYKFKTFQNTFKVFTLVLHWVMIIGTCIILACGILFLTEWGDFLTRLYFLPLIFIFPLIHPVIVHFASPQFLFLSWNVEKMDDDFFEY